jgi:hypothetical protein
VSSEPIMEQLALEDETGAILEEVGPSFGPGLSPPQSVYLAMHDAPAEGHLVVQITSVGALESSVGSATIPSASASATVPFVFYVQRQDHAPASESAAPAQSQAALGSVATPSVLLAADSGATSVSTIAAAAAGDGAPSGLDAAMASAVNTDVAIASDLPENFNFRVLTGPLASRSSGPLGPILADADVDPAPAVDRHERALVQDIKGIEEDSSAMTEHRDDLAAVSTRGHSPLVTSVWARFPEESDASDGSIGRDVHDQDRLHQSGRRAGLSGLVAALAVAQVSDATTSGMANLDARAKDRQPILAHDPIAPLARKARPDYIKAAFGLALGLGLTAGPLFPNLLASGRVRVPKWMRKRSGKSGTNRLVPAPRRQMHAIRKWFGRRFASGQDRLS